MRPLVYAMSFLFAGLEAAASEGGVRFERKYTADPCDDKALILTTWVQGSKIFKHGFRLNSTDAVFFGYGLRPVLIWQAPTSAVDVSTEMAFFGRQGGTVAKAVEGFLKVSGLVTLYYEFNTRTRDLVLDIYVSKRLVSSYRDGKVRFQPMFHWLGTEVRDFVGKYATGIGTDILKSRAAELERKWFGFCTEMKKMANVTAGNYSLTYDSEKNETTCSVESEVSWFHLVFFDSRIATVTKREYDKKGRTHLTVGRTKGKEFTVCNITFPDGTIALQTFSSEDGLGASTPSPSPITTSPRPAEISPESSVSSSPFLSLFSSPDAKTASGETSEASASGAGGTAAGVTVVTLLLLVGGIGVFLYRDRLKTFFFRFQRVPTEG